MIQISHIKISPKRVYQNENFLIQVKVDKDNKVLAKLSFKLSTKLGGGIPNGTKDRL